LRSRKFTLNFQSKYKALLVDDEQYKAITEYEGQMRVPVFYLLYNPWILPWSMVLPLVGKPKNPPRREVGARILPAARLRAALGGREAGYAPSYNDLGSNAPPEFQGAHTAGWRLEHFIVDRLLCRRRRRPRRLRRSNNGSREMGPPRGRHDDSMAYYRRGTRDLLSPKGDWDFAHNTTIDM
jgi:hypothetical protein